MGCANPILRPRPPATPAQAADRRRELSGAVVGGVALAGLPAPEALGRLLVVALDRPWSGAATGLLFPALNGGYLDLHNFRNRNWKPAQLAAGIEELIESSFKFAERLLAAQHEFAKNVLAAAAPVMKKTSADNGSESASKAS